MTIEKDFFRQVMGHFATGVTIVTTSNNGDIAGLTVNAFCSLSIDPPLVLVCIDNASQNVQLFRESKIFAVNMLTDQQEDLSRCFATQNKSRYERFCDTSYRIAASGAPIIDQALGFIDTRIVAEHPGGDHTIFIGQVVAMGYAGQAIFATDSDRAQSTLIEHDNNYAPFEEASPLAYYRGQYRHLATHYQKPSLGETKQTVPYHENVEEPTRGH